METAQRRLALADPEIYGGWKAQAESLQASLVGQSERGLQVALLTVFFVLLVVSVNLANLMTGRCLGRRREVATRLALGGSRASIVFEAAVEGGLLSLAGAGVGALLAVLGLRALPRWLPFELPRQSEIAFDSRSVLALLALTLGATALFAVLPAIFTLPSRLSDTLRGAGNDSSISGTRLRRVVIATQIALSLPLLVSAGLLTRTRGESTTTPRSRPGREEAWPC